MPNEKEIALRDQILAAVEVGDCEKALGLVDESVRMVTAGNAEIGTFIEATQKVMELNLKRITRGHES
jgi:hypothetical protein